MVFAIVGKRSTSWGASFFVFRHSPQSAILISMRLAPIVSMLVMSLALNAETIQGKVVRVSDGDTITILDEARATRNLWLRVNIMANSV